MLIGIFIGLANCDIRIESNYRSNLGYQVKPRLQVRGEIDFLNALQRSLLQHNIVAKIKEKESTVRPKPILRITKISDLHKICEMIPQSLADARNQWTDFRTVIEIMNNKEHLTLDGLDRILMIKGLI